MVSFCYFGGWLGKLGDMMSQVKFQKHKEEKCSIPFQCSLDDVVEEYKIIYGLIKYRSELWGN